MSIRAQIERILGCSMLGLIAGAPCSTLATAIFIGPDGWGLGLLTGGFVGFVSGFIVGVANRATEADLQGKTASMAALAGLTLGPIGAYVLLILIMMNVRVVR